MGHGERGARRNKITKLLTSPLQSLDESLRVLIKKGPVSEETSLKELVEMYSGKPEWRVVENRGVLSIPVQEFRMINPPQPDGSGLVDFGKKKGGGGKLIENYPVVQTTENLKDLILQKYCEEKEKAKAAGKSTSKAERDAEAKTKNLPEMIAVQKWDDNDAEIKLKQALENMMRASGIPALVVRSVSLKAIHALKDLGLKLPGDGELDLMTAYVSGDFLHVVICEVKRADTYPWKTKCALPNKQAVNKAENQLTKDLDILKAILAGIPPSQVIYHTLACYPDSSFTELQEVFCEGCLQTDVICQEDLADLSLLQKKTQVPDKPDPATNRSMQFLLTLTARCLSHQSLLHVGYREVEDKEKLVTARHRYNLESVDGKMKQNEFVVASPQQQQVIASFTAAATTMHLVLEGPAGTGKTLVALQVANNLVESLTVNVEEGLGPVLVVTTQDRDGPIMNYLDDRTASADTKLFKKWHNIKSDFRIFGSDSTDRLIQATESLAKRWEGRNIVMLMDEIVDKDMLRHLEDDSIPKSVRMVMTVNPKESRSPLTLPPSFLRVTLTTPYRSTIAITSLARFIAKRYNLHLPEGDFGSDVEGMKPIFFDICKDVRKMEGALAHCRKHLGENATILYGQGVPSRLYDMAEEHCEEKGGAWNSHQATNFYGWEADKVVALTDGASIMELITRAKTHLCVFLVAADDDNNHYVKTKAHFQQAVAQGLLKKAVFHSTIAITSLVSFVANCNGLVLPEGDFGNVVEGIKPILFEIGKDASTLEDTLFYLWSYLGRDAIILTDSLPQLKSIREMVQQFGGFLQSCHHVNDSFLEGEQVVAITTGANAMELITKAHTWLCVILVEEEDYLFTQTKKQFEQAADQGLIKKIEFSSTRAIRSFCCFVTKRQREFMALVQDQESVAKSKVRDERIIFECYRSPAEYSSGNVDGSKPIIFDVGKDNGNMKKALEHCHTLLGDNVTFYLPINLVPSMRKVVEGQVKDAGRRSNEMSGSDKVVLVTTGDANIYQITKARTHLCIILAEPHSGAVYWQPTGYVRTKRYLQMASDEGLVEYFQMASDEGLVEMVTLEDDEIEKGCLPGCCTS